MKRIRITLDKKTNIWIGDKCIFSFTVKEAEYFLTVIDQSKIEVSWLESYGTKRMVSRIEKIIKMSDRCRSVTYFNGNDDVAVNLYYKRSE